MHGQIFVHSCSLLNKTGQLLAKHHTNSSWARKRGLKQEPKGILIQNFYTIPFHTRCIWIYLTGKGILIQKFYTVPFRTRCILDISHRHSNSKVCNDPLMCTVFSWNRWDLTKWQWASMRGCSLAHFLSSDFLQKLVGAFSLLALRANKPLEFLQKLASLAKTGIFSLSHSLTHPF